VGAVSLPVEKIAEAQALARSIAEELAD
jgi:hypothetical protein